MLLTFAPLWIRNLTISSYPRNAATCCSNVKVGKEFAKEEVIYNCMLFDIFRKGKMCFLLHLFQWKWTSVLWITIFFEIKNYNYYMREFTYQCGPSIVIGFTRISSRTDQTLQTEQVSMVSSIVHSENKFCFLPWYQVCDVWFELLPSGFGFPPLQEKQNFICS